MAEADIKNPRGPLLLGLLGPMGLAGGAVMSSMIGNRRRGEQKQLDQQALQGALGGEQLSKMNLPGLLDAAYKLELNGVAIPKTLADQIEFLQADAVVDEAVDERQAEQQTNFGQSLMLADRQNELRMAAQLQQDQRAFQNAKALEQYKVDLENGQAAGAVEYGPVGAGTARVTLDDGTKRDVLIPGSVPYQSALEPVQTTAAAMDLTTQIIDEIDKTGGDFAFGNTKRQSLLYQQMVSVLGQLTNSGVLQAEEAERFLNALPDPTALFPRTDKSMKAPYEELLRQLVRAQEFNVQKFSGEPISADMVFPIQAAQPPPPPGTKAY